MSKQKVLVIVGPTASGKTALSIALAKHFQGEVISADSRQVYRGLDIGTGKVTEREMSGIPHHMLDLADPRHTYTVSDFVADAGKAIEEILTRGRLPIVAGGTFFYVDALLGRITLPDLPPNPLLRRELEERDAPALYALLKAKDPAYAEIVEKDNPRRLIRALEIIEAVGHMPEPRTEERYEALTLGIEVTKEALQEKIHDRLLQRLNGGMIEEVQHLLENDVSYERLQELGIEYRYISQYLRDEISYDVMQEEIETKSRQYAKRQMTWLKRNKEIIWVDPKDQKKIEEIVKEFLGR